MNRGEPLLSRDKELVQALEAVDNQLAHPEQVTSDKLMIRILNFFGVSNVAQ